MKTKLFEANHGVAYDGQANAIQSACAKWRRDDEASKSNPPLPPCPVGPAIAPPRSWQLGYRHVLLRDRADTKRGIFEGPWSS